MVMVMVRVTHTTANPTSGDLWVFDAHTLSWRSIETGEGGPAARSYHVMASHGSCVYLFGGCGAMGRCVVGCGGGGGGGGKSLASNQPTTTTTRLNDLYVFDTEQEKWEQLHPAAGSQQPSPRGGPALFATADKVYVFGQSRILLFLLLVLAFPASS